MHLYFVKLSWGMENDSTLFKKNDNMCLCLILVISHPLSYCAGYSMPLCRHSIAFTICLRDRQTAKSFYNRCYLVMCIAVWWWSVYAAVCAACWVNFKYCTATYQFFASTLASDDAPCRRKEQGLALRQEQCGCSRFRSFLYSFWKASSFVQDSIKNFQKKGFPESLFCSFFWSNQLSQTIARTKTKRYRPDAGPLLAEKLLFLAHVARPKWAASKRKTWQGSDVSRMSCWNWKWKMWKRNFRAKLPSKSENGRCENEASCETSVVVVIAVVVTVVGDSGGCGVIVVVVLVVATVPWRKWMSENFVWLCCCIWKCQEISHPLLVNHQNTMEYTGNTNIVSQNLKNDNAPLKVWWLGTIY